MLKTSKILLVALLFIVLTIGCSPKKQEDVFLDQSGKEVKLSNFKGKIVLMSFIMTSCPNKKCDLITLQLLRTQFLLIDKLGKDFFLVSVSIDPEKDTPEVLKEYAKKFKADPEGWFFITGSSEATDRLRKKYNVEWKISPDGTRRHRVVMVVLDQKGETAFVYNDYNYDTLKMADEISNLSEGKKPEVNIHPAEL